MNAVDTNILIYAVDFDEPAKRPVAVEVLKNLSQEPEFVIPWQVAGEFLACLRRWEDHGKITRTQTTNYLAEFIESVPIAYPTFPVIPSSLDLSNRFSLSHWDSMLLAACIEAGVETLYSENMDAATQYDTLRIVNPFA